MKTPAYVPRCFYCKDTTGPWEDCGLADCECRDREGCRLRCEALARRCEIHRGPVTAACQICGASAESVAEELAGHVAEVQRLEARIAWLRGRRR